MNTPGPDIGRQYLPSAMRLIIVVLALFASLPLDAQTRLVPSNKDSKIKFTIRNFGLNVDGSMDGIQGDISFDPAAPARASFDVTVPSASVQTGNKMRDDHLRKSEYLNVVQFQKLRFQSISVASAGGLTRFIITGMLTIKGISRKISFPFEAEKVPGGYRFAGTFRINRRDFNVGGSSISLNDYLTISLQITAFETP